MNGSAPQTEAKADLCSCDRPIPRERAEHKWAARTYCAKCGLDMPLRWR